MRGTVYISHRIHHVIRAADAARPHAGEGGGADNMILRVKG